MGDIVCYNIGDFCIIMFGDSGRIGVFTVSYVQCFLACFKVYGGVYYGYVE